MVQNRCQKWKEHVKNMKVAKFEAPYIEDWVLWQLKFLGNLKGIVQKIMLVSETLLTRNVFLKES